jgi:uncharacterized protein YyaL (SSP411 family)
LNRLINEKSAYLRHSATQKIDWYPWGEEAFEKAKREDKPVFLSSGAIWCHWCHVMAEECFTDDEIVDILNKNYVCIKLDRDERPDIDRRFQKAVQIISGTGGWPLSVFLTPDGKPFFGGTYFPPDDRYGRPGFKKILHAVVDFYRKNKSKVIKYSSELLKALSDETKTVSGEGNSGRISQDLLERAKGSIISTYDPQNGGFGTSPKFPLCGAIEFLINRAFFEGKDSFLTDIVTRTLTAMAKGGIHDQLGGGFHRYSTDSAWIIPHFEKMADDNAWLLRNYIDAFCLTGNEYFKEVAEGIIDFIFETLADPEGGFYASQDADVTPDDEGGYFTWTEDEIKEVLSEEEIRVISAHLFHEKGAMHHNPERHVLFVVKEAEEIAKDLREKTEKITEMIKRAKAKLLERRRLRQQPFVDKNLYTSINGMLITSFLRSARFLKHQRAGEFALNSLERIIKLRFLNGMLYHSDNVKGLLDDYAYTIEALISAYEFTGSKSYLEKATALLENAIDKFYDNNGGFFDTDEPALGIKLKGIEDSPHPSANAVMIINLLKLYHLTDNRSYLEKAEVTLKAFSEIAQAMAAFTAYYFVALDMYQNMLRFSIYAKRDSELYQRALLYFRPYLTIHYPEKGAYLSFIEREYILPCLRERCLEPVYNREDLLKAFLMHQPP